MMVKINSLKSLLADLLHKLVEKSIKILTREAGLSSVRDGEVRLYLSKPEKRGMNMPRQDWLLEVLKSAEGECLSPVQLQKILYVLGRECQGQVGPEYDHFTHYNYGPFSTEIYHDLESPTLGRSVKAISRRGQRWREYAITEEGVRRAEASDIPDNIRVYIKKVVDWARPLSFDQLVRAIYKKYPETRENSIFQV
ncbi:MAG: hypothetical protein WBG50_04040 [Desulfomonilaceae bacterium]